MKKRGICLLLGSVLVFGVTACAPGGGGIVPQDENATVTLNCFDWSLYENAKKDSIMKKVIEDTSVDFALSSMGTVGIDAYARQLKMKTNIGEAPGVFFYDVSSDRETVNNWVNQDVLVALDDYLDDYPNLKTVLTSEQYKNLTFNGKHYFIPRINSSNQWGIYCRKDWIENLQKDADGAYRDVTVPADDGSFTLEDFEYLLEAFTKGDPDGNGKNDTYGLTLGSSYSWGLPLMSAFCDYQWNLVERNGQKTYEYSLVGDGYKDYLTWMNGLYTKGYLEKSFYENTSDQMKFSKFWEGKAGILIANAEQFVPYALSNCVYEAEDLTFIAPPVGTANVGVEGKGGFLNYGGWWGGWFISQNCTNIKGVLNLLDYMYGVEGSNLLYYGIPGYHYVRGANGEYSETEQTIANKKAEPEGTFRLAEDEFGDSFYGFCLWGDYITWPLKSLSREKISIRTDFIGYEDRARKLAIQGAELVEKFLYTPTLYNYIDWPMSVNETNSKLFDTTDIYTMHMIIGSTYNGKRGIDALWNDYLSATSAQIASVKTTSEELLRQRGMI